MMGLLIVTLILASCIDIVRTDSKATDEESIQEEAYDTMADTFRPGISFQQREGEVVVFTLSKNAFQEFLMEPSIASLTKGCVGLDVFRKHPILPGYVQLMILIQNGIKMDEENPESNCYDTHYYVGNGWRIDTGFIDFMNNADNLKRVLADCNAEREILSCVFIVHDYSDTAHNQLSPPGMSPAKCIWIHTDSGDYFLELNAYSPENALDTDYVNDFYDLAGYIKKYGDEISDSSAKDS